MSKPTPPANDSGRAQLMAASGITEPVKRTRAPMPTDLQAANRIDQILNALSLEDAELVLDRANRMLAKRKAAVDKSPHVPAD